MAAIHLVIAGHSYLPSDQVTSSLLLPRGKDINGLLFLVFFAMERQLEAIFQKRLQRWNHFLKRCIGLGFGGDVVVIGVRPRRSSLDL